MPGGSRCSVSLCQSTSAKAKASGERIIFYGFPKNPKLRKEWIERCDRKDKFNPDTARLCSKHFVIEDFEDSLKAQLLNIPPKKLKATAIPSNLLPNPYQDFSTSPTESILQENTDPDISATVCAVSSCKNSYHSLQEESLQLHAFPEDPTIRDKWITFCKRPEKWNANTSKICSNHFKEDDFIEGTKESGELKRNAVPTVTLFDLPDNEVYSTSSTNESGELKINAVPTVSQFDLPDNEVYTTPSLQPKFIIDLRDTKDLCRTCLQKSTNLTSINDTVTLSNAQETVIVISEVLKSFLCSPLAFSDQIPNQICDICKSQLVLIATIRFAFEVSNSILQMYCSGQLEEQSINKSNPTDTDMNQLPQIKAEPDMFEETIHELQRFEDSNFGMGDDLNSFDDPLSTEQRLMSLIKEEPKELDSEENTLAFNVESFALEPEIDILEATDDSATTSASETPKPKKHIDHTCPICYITLSLRDFISHVRRHKTLQKYLRGPKNPRRGRYYALPRTDKGLLGSVGEKLHTCHICQQKLKAVDYMRHLHRHLNVDHFTCDKCDRVFKKRKFLLTHMLVHNGDPPYRCDTCGKGFVIENNYKCHLLTHKDDELPHACPECDKKFSNPNHLRRHMTIHNENIRYQDKYRHKTCCYCHEAVRGSEGLEHHICKNPGYYRCKYCYKLFETVTARNTHLRSDHIRKKKSTPGFCKECNSVVTDMNSHKALTHTKRMKSLCSVCGCYVWNIQSHTQKHITVKRTPSFRCSVCSKLFSHSQVLRKHMLIHTGEKPFMCSFCAKAFNSKYNLEVHERIHLGDRRHVCTVCHKGFLEKSHLNKHMKTHNVESWQESGFGPNVVFIQES